MSGKRTTSQGSQLCLLTDWLTELQQLWASERVLRGKSSVDVENLTTSNSHINRQKRQRISLDETIERLEQLPFDRNADEQSQIQSLVELLIPIAEPDQVVRLESTLSSEIAALYLALDTHDISSILEAPLLLWRPSMIPMLKNFDQAVVCALLSRWAAQQEKDSCLRESDALVWWIQQQIGESKVKLDPTSKPSVFLKRCCRICSGFPGTELVAIQAALPVQEVDGIPSLLFMLLFRLSSSHEDPKAVLSLIKRNEPALPFEQLNNLFKVNLTH